MSAEPAADWIAQKYIARMFGGAVVAFTVRRDPGDGSFVCEATGEFLPPGKRTETQVRAWGLGWHGATLASAVAPMLADLMGLWGVPVVEWHPADEPSRPQLLAAVRGAIAALNRVGAKEATA